MIGPTCDQLKANLAAAEDAWHQLNMGATVVSIQYGEKRIEYARANLAGLGQYLQSLRRQVAACTGETYSPRRILQVFPK